MVKNNLTTGHFFFFGAEGETGRFGDGAKRNAFTRSPGLLVFSSSALPAPHSVRPWQRK